MFKFYTIRDEATLDNIIGDKRTIKMSSAFNLNDPFELKFNLKIDPFAPGQMEEFLAVHPTKTPKDFEDWQDQVKDNDGYVWYTEQTQRNDLAQAITLCSFTDTNKNNLMWSHYTDNHQGICVEYEKDILETLSKNKDFIIYAPVEYLDMPPVIDILADFKIKLRKMVFNKQAEWKYEREHRIVFYSRNDTDYLPIDRSVVKAVYLGSRMPDELEKKAIEICNANGIECYQGISLGKSYEVQFEKFKPGTFYTRTFWRP